MDLKNIKDCIEVYPLGAGQDVGRSCILIKIYDKIIMLDCGLHMGVNDLTRYPDFEKIKQIWNIPEKRKWDQIIDLVLISHFHLDHIGALPYFTEIYNYDGPIYMTSPTKALLPYMCEDFRKVITESQKKEFTDDSIPQTPAQKIINDSRYPLIYTQENIQRCFQKAKTIQLLETIDANGIKIKPYYAGHVLGACMFMIEYRNVKVVYTGDFHSNADRHLGAAWIEKVKPDLLISECTYGTIIRDSKRAREKNFLKQIQETIDQGGKVLIPVFALGRAQELCILLETYWQRTQSQVPVYFAAGMIEKANFYYKLFVNWTNEKIKSSYLTDNMFDFKYIKPFSRSLIKTNGPMVLFATPGMLHAGLSMQVFKEWCFDEKNTLIIPGYCVAGTLGNKLLSGCKQVILDKKIYDVNMQVKNMSFSAHADAKGILGLIKHCEPKNVMLVHGDVTRMMPLAETIRDQFEIQVFTPANFELNKIPLMNEDNYQIKITEDLKREIEEQKMNEINGLIFYNQDKQYQILRDLEEFQQLLNQLSDEYDAYWHRFETGYLIKINLSVKNKCSDAQKPDQIDKNKLIYHYKQILEAILKMHEKAKDTLSDYLELCNTDNFDVLDNEFLVIKTSQSFTPQQQKIIDSIFNALNIYNNK
ncbi:hypothetical protein ABPG72_019634 [Tetrahymena utriculariae]